MPSLRPKGSGLNVRQGKGVLQGMKPEVSPRAVLCWRRQRSFWKCDSKVACQSGKPDTQLKLGRKAQGGRAGAAKARTRCCRLGQASWGGGNSLKKFQDPDASTPNSSDTLTAQVCMEKPNSSFNASFDLKKKKWRIHNKYEKFLELN